MEDSIRELIINYISEKGIVPVHELTPETEIYESNIISSLSLLEMVSLIEETYSIVIEPEDLTEDNFKYVQTIVDYINKKLKS